MRHSRLLATAGLLLITLGCSDSTEPTMESVAGTYTATTFSIGVGDSSTDLLATGGSITLTLNANGGTTGRIVIPGLGEGGSDFDEALTGTWALVGTTVTLDHAADTFLRDMSFTVSGDRLSGEMTFGEETITVVLEK